MRTSVSVLLSVHNGEAYFERSLRSVLGQSFADFEFIIVDDGSDDATPRILAAIRDKRIQVIRNPRNLGLTRSLNLGLKVASGRWIARIDADDAWVDDKLSIQLERLSAEPEIKLCGSFAEAIDEGDTAIEVLARPETHACILAEALFRNPFIHSSVLFCRETALRLGGYDERYERAQDYALWVQFLGNGAKACNIPKPLTKWRQHNARVTLTQAERMEKCRTTILAEAHQQLLGIAVSSDVLHAIEQLRVHGRRPAPLLRSIHYMRRLFLAFQRRYTEPESRAAMQAQIDRLIARLAKPNSPLRRLLALYCGGWPRLLKA